MVHTLYTSDCKSTRAVAKSDPSLFFVVDQSQIDDQKCIYILYYIFLAIILCGIIVERYNSVSFQNSIYSNITI